MTKLQDQDKTGGHTGLVTSLLEKWPETQKRVKLESTQNWMITMNSCIHAFIYSHMCICICEYTVTETPTHQHAHTGVSVCVWGKCMNAAQVQVCLEYCRMRGVCVFRICAHVCGMCSCMFGTRVCARTFMPLLPHAG